MSAPAPEHGMLMGTRDETRLATPWASLMNSQLARSFKASREERPASSERGASADIGSYRSAAFLRLLGELRRLARSAHAPILLEGESGSGRGHGQSFAFGHGFQFR